MNRNVGNEQEVVNLAAFKAKRKEIRGKFSKLRGG